MRLFPTRAGFTADPGYDEHADAKEAARIERLQAECPHEEGTRIQNFDADGCGFYTWRCDRCGAEFYDTMG